MHFHTKGVFELSVDFHYEVKPVEDSHSEIAPKMSVTVHYAICCLIHFVFLCTFEFKKNLNTAFHK